MRPLLLVYFPNFKECHWFFFFIPIGTYFLLYGFTYIYIFVLVWYNISNFIFIISCALWGLCACVILKSFRVPRVITWLPSLQWHQLVVNQIETLKREPLHCSHASLRAGSDPEGDAATGDGGRRPAHGGDPDGARRGGEKPGEPGREAAALQDDKTQPEAQQRDLLSGGLLLCSKHPRRLAQPPAPWRGRGETHCDEEGRAGAPKQLLWPLTITSFTFFFISPITQVMNCT